MRHRLCVNTGLGNPNKEILDNNFKLPKSLHKFADEFINTFSLPRQYQGFDYSLNDVIFRLGIEPAYEGEYLEMIYFDLSDKTNCCWIKGIAKGAYGTGIRKTYKFYGEYKRKSKFIKFIDKWYDIVVRELRKV